MNGAFRGAVVVVAVVTVVVAVVDCLEKARWCRMVEAALVVLDNRNALLAVLLGPLCQKL
jgi:hypothetical protein